MDKNELEKKETGPEQPQGKGNLITRLYDRLPFSFKQVDLFVKVMIVVTVAVLIYGIVKGNQ